MENKTSSQASSGNQTRKRKTRNTDIRKEQNRIASRAYREKRKQKLALLDEILRSDSHTDSMSSVSDETDYRATTPAWEFRVMELTGGTRHPSNSPVPFYTSPGPALAQMSASPQPLVSGSPSCNMEIPVDCFVNGYSQETGRLAHHAEYAHYPNIATIETNAAHIYAPRPATPMFAFDDDVIGDSFNTYSLPNGGMTGYPPASEFDPNMINALESLSRLSDSQQRQIVAHIEKQRHSIQRGVAESTSDLGFVGYPSMNLGRVQGQV